MAGSEATAPPTSPRNYNNPNAIPPRSSSHGAIGASAAANLSPPQKSVLRPLPENDWLGGPKRQRMSSPPAMTGAQQPELPPNAPSALYSSMVSPADVIEAQKQQLPIYGKQLTPPPPEPPKDYGDWFIFSKHHDWSDGKDKVVLGPFEYLYGHPGKEFRSQLIAAFNAWLKVPEESLQIITRVVGTLHTSSLLIDDVEDQSVLRRGIPVAHSIFGTAQTINSANYTSFLALSEVMKLKNPNAINIFTEELLNLHRGQGMELFWRDTLTCPSEDDYLEMVGFKTGGLFRLAIKLMQAESPTTVDCIPLVNTISLVFQILDDYKNLLSPIMSSKKGLCEDLTEGKFSFPVIHAVRVDQSNRVILNILKMKPTDEAVKHYAVDYMQRVGSFEYSRKVILELSAKAASLAREVESLVAQSDPTAAATGMAGMKVILSKLKVDD